MQRLVGRSGIVFALGLAIALGNLACASTRVNVDERSGTDWARYASYSQSPEPRGPLGDRIRVAIASELEARGLRPASPGDLAVSFDLALVQETRRSLLNDPDASCCEIKQVLEQQLTVTVREVPAGIELWSAEGRTDLEDPTAAERTAVAAVGELFERFPVERSAP